MSKPEILKEELTEMQIRILNALKIGHANATPLRELCRKTEISERKLRMAIEVLRNEGFLIVFFPSKPEGYGIAETPDEATTFIEYMRSRIKNECKIMRSIKQASFKRFTHQVGQLQMYL